VFSIYSNGEDGHKTFSRNEVRNICQMSVPVRKGKWVKSAARPLPLRVVLCHLPARSTPAPISHNTLEPNGAHAHYVHASHTFACPVPQASYGAEVDPYLPQLPVVKGPRQGLLQRRPSLCTCLQCVVTCGVSQRTARRHRTRVLPYRDGDVGSVAAFQISHTPAQEPVPGVVCSAVL
jgi:hypothetical protein